MASEASEKRDHEIKNDFQFGLVFPQGLIYLFTFLDVKFQSFLEFQRAYFFFTIFVFSFF